MVFLIYKGISIILDNKPLNNISLNETNSDKKKKKRRKKKLTMAELRKDENNLTEENLSEPQKRLEGARFRFLNEQLYFLYKIFLILDLQQALKKHKNFLKKMKMHIKLIIKVFNYR